MWKKAALLASLVAIAGSAFAANRDLCPSLAGAWGGTYTTSSGQQQPIGLYISYENGYIYGYTLKNNDSNGYNFGSYPGKYLLWANCSNSEISNLTFVNYGNNQAKCGAVNSNSQPVHLDMQQTLTLQIPYNGQMVQATFPNTPKVVAREWYIQQAMKFGGNLSSNVQACQQ